MTDSDAIITHCMCAETEKEETTYPQQLLWPPHSQYWMSGDVSSQYWMSGDVSSQYWMSGDVSS